MKPGYLYVLVHPSDPNLFKVGQTTLHPEDRLAQHNRNGNREKYAGQIVEETGLKWELKTYVAVPDPYWAETVFWSATGLADVPFRGGIEIERMEWSSVLAGLNAAQKAGVRPPLKIPDHVYAHTAWMKKRLQGRDIALSWYVRSKHGKASFKCSDGHEWRAVANNVAEGDGCPQCGVGERTPEEIRNATRPAILCLLIHPDKPGVVKIGLTYSSLEHCQEENFWNGWLVHRYRNVEEPDLAEKLIWDLLGCPRLNNGDPIKMDLSVAEQAFRDLTSRMQSEAALAEVVSQAI